MAQFNPLRIEEPGRSDNPLYAGTPSEGAALGGAITQGVDRLGQWLSEQRAKSEKMGLWANGRPTAAGWVNAAQQYGSGLQPATIAGVGAATADLQALARARAMAVSGEGRDAILAKTGWWRGPDGKWRFEISDKGATVNPSAVSGGKLDTFIDHPDLFKAYPELADVTVQTMSRRGGSYSSGDDAPLISINDKLPKGSLLHETQHAIQDIEAFERGGSIMGSTARPEFQEALQKRIKSVTTPLSYEEYANLAWGGEKSTASLADYNNSYLKTVPKSVDLYSDLGKTIQESAAREVYQRLFGEVEARAVDARMNLTDRMRRGSGPWYGYDIPESQHIVRSPR